MYDSISASTRHRRLPRHFSRNQGNHHHQRVSSNQQPKQLRKRIRRLRRAAKRIRLLAQSCTASARLAFTATADRLVLRANDALAAVNDGDFVAAAAVLHQAELVLFMLRRAA